MSFLRRAALSLTFVAVPLALIGALPSIAGADVVHLVVKGEKMADVAKRYGVTPKALASANKLKEGAALKPGQKLVVPVTPKGGPPVSNSVKSASFVGAPKTPGHVTLVRLGSKERLEIQLVNKKGKLVPGVMPRMARMMRFVPLNIEHAIDAELIERIAKVSDHFGGRAIEIISGFRPKTPTQYTPHSNHNVGKAIDMRIPGVPNEVVRDYCRTFKAAGVGYYPNSLFVHFDVRSQSTFWIDLSRTGDTARLEGEIVNGWLGP